MAYERSAGFIVFREENGKRLYLLLYKSASGTYSESWSFPKGLIEPGEDELTTARRECEEETGLKNLEQIPNFKHKIHYVYKKGKELVSKDVIYFLAKTNEKDVKVSFEHAGYTWLPFEDALKKLTFKTDKEVLTTAEQFLKNFASKK